MSSSRTRSHRSGRATRRLASVLGAAALLATALIAGMATPASAATVIRETITLPFSESGAPHDCRPGVIGEIRATDVINVQTVETSTGFHVNGTSIGAGRIEWSDGTHTIIEWQSQSSFHAIGQGTTVFTQAHKDSGDTYSAGGEFLFHGTFHLVEKLTVTDGVPRVEFVRSHLHIFGYC